MNRVQDYFGFAMWFLGLGYIALWPLTAHDDGVALLDMLSVCGRQSVIAELICASHGEMHLSPGLHLVGVLAVAGVILGLAGRPIRRWLRLRATARGRLGALVPRRYSNRRAPPPRRFVKPRSQFGLRGAPR